MSAQHPKEAAVAHYRVDRAWLEQRREAPIDPDLPIVDPHHHLWGKPGELYLLPEFLEDLGGGHNVRATVFVECSSMYRPDGPTELRSLGEIEFAAGAAVVSASGNYGPARICAGIVGYVDLRLGAAVKDILQLHMAAAEGRLKGIRNVATWHEDSALRQVVVNPQKARGEGLFLDGRFREGFACLAPLGLSFDAWIYHTQIADLVDLATCFPETTIIIDHVGGPIGVGPYAGRRQEVFADWRTRIRELARHRNVYMKLGGLGMKLSGFGFGDLREPPFSPELAAAWAPYIEECIASFGPERCMFESNFPVDKGTCSYTIVWNAFKRIAKDFSQDQKEQLFSGTASRVYRLSVV